MSEMSKYCNNCYCDKNVKKIYSKFNGYSYYCDICYDKMKDEEANKYSIQPMNIYKIVSEKIDGIDKNFVMIDKEEYDNYILFIALKNKKLANNEYLKKKQEKEQKQEEIELKRINEYQERERREKEKEEERKKNIEKEIKMNKFNNEKIKKIKEELQEEYKEVFKNDKNAKIQKCDFCNKYQIYPIHYKDENNKIYEKEYTKDKKCYKSICCMDCNQETEQKKLDKKFKNTEHCLICNSNYIALNDNTIICHLNSLKHKKNQAILEEFKGTTTKKDLSLLSVKELNKICSKSINDDGTYRINNYTKTKKSELVLKMNAIYNLLKFD